MGVQDFSNQGFLKYFSNTLHSTGVRGLSPTKISREGSLSRISDITCRILGCHTIMIGCIGAQSSQIQGMRRNHGGARCAGCVGRRGSYWTVESAIRGDPHNF
jgi:hypothetical protein